MLLLPYDEFLCETGLSAAQARRLIEQVIAPKRSFTQSIFDGVDQLFKPVPDQFNGEVDNEGFRLRRSINYSNSFRPILRGRFETRTTGVLVRVSMMPHPVALFVAVLWFLAIGTGAVISTPYVFKEGFHPEYLMPHTMILLAWGVIQAGFIFEARKATKILTELFLNSSNHLLSRKCPFCRSDLRDRDSIVECPACATGYHRECSIESGKCTVYGCGTALVVKQ